MPSSSERYVWLRGGLTLPLEPVLLLLDLEGRGCSVTRGADDKLIIRPAATLTDDDCAALRRWKQHVLALVDYCDSPPEVM